MIVSILMERNLRVVANYLVLSLAVADLLVAVLVMPLGAVNEVSKENFLLLIYLSLRARTLLTRINDPVRIKLTRCKKRVNFYARVTEIGSEHKGNRYQAFCFKKL